MLLTTSSFRASHIDPELVPSVVTMCLKRYPGRVVKIEPVMLMGEADACKVVVYGRHGRDGLEYVEL